jgi:hypothetical protein
MFTPTLFVGINYYLKHTEFVFMGLPIPEITSFSLHREKQCVRNGFLQMMLKECGGVIFATNHNARVL